MPAPAAEMEIGADLVRTLLRAQHPDLADLPLTRGPEGWDNQQWRLGDDLVVRLPRRELAARTVANEIEHLPRLPPLPMPTPRPMRVGEPGSGYPWPWLVAPWLPGTPAAAAVGWDRSDAAVRLAGFMAALHRPSPADAPRNPFRGVPLADRADRFAELAAEAALLPGDAVFAAWEQALAAEPWAYAAAWVHGDAHPHNLLVHDGRLSAVIDFGDLTAGDPATDLAAAWMLFDVDDRAAFWEAYARRARHPVTAALRDRSRGWAVLFYLTLATHVGDDPGWAEVIARTGREIRLSPAR